MKIFRIVISLILISVFIAYAPAFIKKGKDKNVYTLRREQKAESYTGMIELWCINDLKTPERSIASLLLARINSFEKKNPFVFMEMSTMSSEDAKKRLSEGEKPDILCFQLGFAPDSDFTPIDSESELSEAFRNVSDNAFPVMADTYRLLINNTAISGLPFTNELDAVPENVSISALKCGNSIPAASLFFGFSGESSAHTYNFINTPESFFSGEAESVIIPSAHLQDFSADKRASAMDISAYRFSRYTDLVQMIGVCPCDDEKKLECCVSFCKSMLLQSFQKAVLDCGMIPVIPFDFSDSKSISSAEEEAVSIQKTGIIPKNDLIFYDCDKLPLMVSAALSDVSLRPGIITYLTK